jgi:simple sugar transport system ATP-binding protein
MDFGTIRAVDDVTLDVQPGEVLGLVGDNGAGKSTLIKIITGYHRPTAGRIRFLGANVQFRSPAAARELGIETVYQDLAIIDELPLWRNFFLGKELVQRLAPVRVLRTHEMRRICSQKLGEMGLTRLRRADEAASVLSGGERQSLAITRAVHFGARLLLLDEPTASLAVKETQHVFRAIESARARGLGVVYIDHNLAHVHPIADRIAVLDHGRLRMVFRRDEATVDDLIELLVQSRREFAVAAREAVRATPR